MPSSASTRRRRRAAAARAGSASSRRASRSTARAPHSATSDDRQQRRAASHTLGRVRQEDLRREHEHEPVAGGGGPLEEREVAAGVLEQRALVDHRQLEVGVGVVDRLASRLGDDDEREGDGSRAPARGRPDARSRPSRRRCRAGRSCPRRARRRRARARASPRRRPTIVRSRLAPISENPFATSHAAAATAKRASASRPASDERVVADAQIGGRRRDRHEQHGATATLAAATARSEPVDDARALDASTVLLPQSRRSSRYGCSGVGPRRPWSRAFQCWTSPASSGASAMPPTSWTAPDAAVGAGHPISPEPRGGEQRRERARSGTRRTSRDCRSGVAARGARPASARAATGR